MKWYSQFVMNCTAGSVPCHFHNILNRGNHNIWSKVTEYYSFHQSQVLFFFLKKTILDNFPPYPSSFCPAVLFSPFIAIYCDSNLNIKEPLASYNLSHALRQSTLP